MKKYPLFRRIRKKSMLTSARTFVTRYIARVYLQTQDANQRAMLLRLIGWLSVSCDQDEIDFVQKNKHATDDFTVRMCMFSSNKIINSCL